jgi:4-amino-4-deoxy-L-arabinose transferase-like glycosyltransferase
MYQSSTEGNLQPRLRNVQVPSYLATVRRWAICIFGLSLLLRAVYALAAPHIDPFLIRDPLLGDAASYDRVARSLMAGGGYGEVIDRPSAFWPPLYPFFLSAVYSIFGYDLMITRLAQAVVGASLPLTIFLTGAHLGETGAARWASLGAAFYPFLIYYGAWLIADLLFFALIGLMLWIGAQLQREPSYRKAISLGLIAGLAALTKPTIVMQFPFLALWFLMCVVAARRQRVALLLTTFVVFGLVITPWAIRNSLLFGKVVLLSTNGGYTFYGANNPGAFGGHYEHFPPSIPSLNEAQQQDEFYRLGITWIRENPAQFAWITAQKFRRLLSPFSVASSPEDFHMSGDRAIRTVYTFFLLASLCGIGLSLRRWRTFALFYVPILGVITSTFLFYGDTRFFLPAAPSLLLFTGLCLQAILARPPGRRVQSQQ